MVIDALLPSLGATSMARRGRALERQTDSHVLAKKAASMAASVPAFCLPLATRHSFPATHHSPLVFRHSPLTTRHSLCLPSDPSSRLGPQLREARLRLDGTSSPPKADTWPSRPGTSGERPLFGVAPCQLRCLAAPRSLGVRPAASRRCRKRSLERRLSESLCDGSMRRSM
jgi:hypothetical protein